MTFILWFIVAMTSIVYVPYYAGCFGMWLMHEEMSEHEYMMKWSLGLIVLIATFLVVVLCSIFAMGMSGIGEF